MKHLKSRPVLTIILVSVVLVLPWRPLIMSASAIDKEGRIKLPAPVLKSDTSVEEALAERRSVRDFQDSPLTLQQVAQLLWAAQGVTHPDGLRTAPSAGALYPLEVYLVADNVERLAAGVYKYHPAKHELEMIRAGDKLVALSQAALDQECIREAPVSIVIAAVYERTKRKYGERAYRYAQIEVGGVIENVYLQAETLNLGTVVVGAFHDDKVQRVLDMAEGEIPLAIMPVGKVR